MEKTKIDLTPDHTKTVETFYFKVTAFDEQGEKIKAHNISATFKNGELDKVDYNFGTDRYKLYHWAMLERIGEEVHRLQQHMLEREIDGFIPYLNLAEEFQKEE